MICISLVISDVDPLFLYKFIYLFIYLFIYFWLCWAFVSVRGLSLVVASGGHSSSRCVGLSLLRSLLLRSTGSRRAGSVVVAHGPSCSVACGIFPDQGSNPCPLHWQADSQPLHHQGSPHWPSFNGLVDHLYVVFGKIPIQVLCSFLNSIFFILICMNSFYKLNINPLLDKSFENIFSHLVDCLFIWLMVSFAVKSFSVWRSPICFFCFFCFGFSFPRKHIKKYC